MSCSTYMWRYIQIEDMKSVIEKHLNVKFINADLTSIFTFSRHTGRSNLHTQSNYLGPGKLDLLFRISARSCQINTKNNPWPSWIWIHLGYYCWDNRLSQLSLNTSQLLVYSSIPPHVGVIESTTRLICHKPYLIHLWSQWSQWNAYCVQYSPTVTSASSVEWLQVRLLIAGNSFSLNRHHVSRSQIQYKGLGMRLVIHLRVQCIEPTYSAFYCHRKSCNCWLRCGQLKIFQPKQLVCHPLPGW